MKTAITASEQRTNFLQGAATSVVAGILVICSPIVFAVGLTAIDTPPAEAGQCYVIGNSVHCY